MALNNEVALCIEQHGYRKLVSEPIPIAQDFTFLYLREELPNCFVGFSLSDAAGLEVVDPAATGTFDVTVKVASHGAEEVAFGSPFDLQEREQVSFQANAEEVTVTPNAISSTATHYVVKLTMND